MEEASPRKLNILFVEDDRTTRELFSKHIERLGVHSITACESPASASKALEKGGFDIVLSDIEFMVGEQDDVPADETERFFKKVLDAGTALVTFSGAHWDLPVKLPAGVECVHKNRLIHLDELEEVMFDAVDKSKERDSTPMSSTAWRGRIGMSRRPSRNGRPNSSKRSTKAMTRASYRANSS